MDIKKKNKVYYGVFKKFDETGLVKHCFSTRHGGVSTGCATSMNLTFRKQDRDENVRANYDILCETLGFSYDGITFSKQEHDINVENITQKEKGNGFHRENIFQSADGLITREKGIALTTFYADCVPLYFLDKGQKVIALSHAGWRGTVNQIASVTIRKMQTDYGSQPKDILVGIGPSIGGCCFEVDEPVVAEFKKKLPYSTEFIKKDKAIEKYYINLWEINRQILLREGILGNNIEMAGICTKCNPDIFFSHRNTGFERGSMAALMELI